MQEMGRWGWLVSTLAVLAVGALVLVRGQAPVPLAAITEVGTGTVQVSPDTAVVQLGVMSTAPTAAGAITHNDTLMAQVEKAIEGLGVPASDLETVNYNLYPQYGGGKSPAAITGYNASDTLQVTVTDLKLVGQVLSVAVASGANSVQNVQYEVLNQNRALVQAEAEAIAQAKVQAIAAASAMGRSLGAMLSVTEEVPSAQGPFPYNAQTNFAPTAPVLPGSQPVSVTVTVAWSVR